MAKLREPLTTALHNNKARITLRIEAGAHSTVNAKPIAADYSRSYRLQIRPIAETLADVFAPQPRIRRP
jgi:hypothetical protein